MPSSRSARTRISWPSSTRSPPRSPLRERLQAQRLLALYRAGRQADALARYRELRTLLRDEHGLEPGAALRELERAILRHDPALDPPAVADAGRAAAAASPEPGLEPRRRPAPRERRLRRARRDHRTRRRARPRAPAGDPAADLRRDRHRSSGATAECPRCFPATQRSRPSASTRRTRTTPPGRSAPRAASRTSWPTRSPRSRRSCARPLSAAVGVATSELVSGRGRGAGRAGRARRGPARAAVRHPASLCVDAHTVDLAPHAADVRVRRVRRTGRARPVPRHAAAGGPSRSRGRPAVRRSSTATRERALLADALERATAERRPQVVTLLGPPGIGKSRLVREFTTSRAGGNGRGGRPLPLLRREHERVRARRGRARAGRRRRRDAAWPCGSPTSIAASRSPTASRSRSAPAVAAARARRSSGRSGGCSSASADDAPLVVALDDLHWAEPWLLDLVEYLAGVRRRADRDRRARPGPELLEERPSWAGPEGPGGLAVLEPLSPAHTEELVAGLLADQSPPPGTARRIVQQSEGNPLFAEQVVAFAIEQSFASGAALPSTLRALLQERIDRLSDGRARRARARGDRGLGVPPRSRSPRSPSDEAAAVTARPCSPSCARAS